MPAAKAAILQRCGRAGRTAPGIVYHMYTFKAYKELQYSALPEI